MQNSLSLRIARSRQLRLCESAFQGWTLLLQQQRYRRKVATDATGKFVSAAMEAWRQCVQAELSGRVEDFLAAVPLMAGLSEDELKRVVDALEVRAAAAVRGCGCGDAGFGLCVCVVTALCR